MSARLKVIRRHLEPHYHPVSAKSHFTDDFKYTVDNDMLTVAQRHFYEENGYIVIPKLIEDEVLDECCQRFVDICNGRIEKGGMTLMRDISLAKTGAQGEFLYNKAQDILYDDIFEKYILHPRLLDYVSCFTGPDIKGVHSMLINKPPDSGSLTSRHPLHQDLYYFPFRPADKIVAAWTAMEKITLDNGCLVVIPGSHKGELQRHDYPNWKGGVNKGYHGVQGFDDHELASLEMEKGDTVFFHPILIHGSGANLTKGFRKAISCHYAGTDCHFIDIEGTLQESIGREIEEMALKRGVKTSIKEIWEYRSRLVRGRPGTLRI